jgi:hypothetical protein
LWISYGAFEITAGGYRFYDGAFEIAVGEIDLQLWTAVHIRFLADSEATTHLFFLIFYQVP